MPKPHPTHSLLTGSLVLENNDNQTNDTPVLKDAVGSASPPITKALQPLRLDDDNISIISSLDSNENRDSFKIEVMINALKDTFLHTANKINCRATSNSEGDIGGKN